MDGEETVELDSRCFIRHGSIPPAITPDKELFERIWDFHPHEYPELVMYGRPVKTPRQSQAYEKDYSFSNQVAVAQKASGLLEPFLEWARENVDPELMGYMSTGTTEAWATTTESIETAPKASFIILQLSPYHWGSRGSFGCDPIRVVGPWWTSS